MAKIYMFNEPTALIKTLNYVTLGINKLSLGIYLNDNLIGKKAKHILELNVGYFYYEKRCIKILLYI